jgi:hypothetical protein
VSTPNEIEKYTYNVLIHSEIIGYFSKVAS